MSVTMAGFGAFREAETVDFGDVDAFALVGPTGAGKSTVFDAVCFALYGCIPRYDDRRLVAPIITTGAQQALVSLTFEAGGRRYQAVRVAVRTKAGGATTKEARLEEVDGATLAGTSDEVSAAVARLLGLDFDDFCKCVLLPQGAFARFLQQKGKDRQDLLVKLLDLDVYAQVGARAREQATTAKARASAANDRVERLAGATPEALEEARRSSKSLRELRADAEAVRPDVERLLAEAAAHTDAARAADRMGALLAAVAVPPDVTELGVRLGVARAGVAEADARLDAAHLKVTEAEAAVVAVGDVATLQTIRAAHSELEEARRSEAEAAALSVAAVPAVTAAAEGLRAAEVGLDDARSALDEAASTDAAAEVARHLVTGQPCPVCEQVVSVVPERAQISSVQQARAAVKAAEQVVKGAREEHRRLEQVATGAASAAAAAIARREGLEPRVAAHPDIQVLVARLEEATVAGEALGAARAEAKESTLSSRAARQTLDDVVAAQAARTAGFDVQRDAVGELRPPSPQRLSLADDWAALAAWADGRVPEQKALADDHSAQAAKATTMAGERVGDLAARFEAGLGIAGPSTLGAVGERLAAAVAKAEAREASIEADLEEAKSLRVTVAAFENEAAVASMLGTLLKTDQFERWLLAEAMSSLVEGASTTLHRLTSGGFSLEVDDKGEFVVVDHRDADERRSVKTLSGGETFQASLALALALSERVAQLATGGAARLESIFLDEGFGTLDADNLETVASTLEHLGGDGRMVGVITHVAELAERMPVRFVVTKGQRTSRVERVNG